MRRSHRLLAALLIVSVAVGGCALLRYRGAEPPTVVLERAELAAFSMSSQRFDLVLRLHNPNDFMLPIAGFDYALNINGQKLAEGGSSRAVNLPAGGAAAVTVPVKTNLLATGLADDLRQVQRWRQDGGADFQYGLSGHLRLAEVPVALPFRKTGTVHVDLSNW